MLIITSDIKKARALVGEVNEEDLRNADYYFSDSLGIVVPSISFCQHGIRPQHIHPAYSFVLFFPHGQSILPVKSEMRPEHYLVNAISPGVPHEKKQADEFSRYVSIFISKQLYEKRYADYSETSPGEYVWDQFFVPQEVMLLLKKFRAEYQNRLPGYEQVLESLAIVITDQLIRSLLGIDANQEFITERSDVERVIQYMHQNYRERFSVSKLARIVNMSESHLTRAFIKETGIAPMEYLNRLRLDKAKKLLGEGTMNIREISLNCGFNSVAHFSWNFAKHLSTTPSEYQNSYS